MRFAQIASGIGWTSAAAVLNLLAQFVFLGVLARQLEPAAFGTMLMAVVATRFAMFFAQLGGAQTLIQAPTLTPGLTSAAVYIAAGVSAALYLGLVLGGPLFAWYFGAKELVPVLQLFALTLPLTALGALPMALLRRQGRFQASSSIDVVGYVVGYGATGVTLAIMGFGVWSLVIATLAQQALVLVLAFAVARYPFHWRVPSDAWRQALGNGSRYSLLGFLEFLWANVESLLIGRQLGQAALGLINRAQLLCNLPVEQAVNIASKVLFPALSAMQAERARMADGFLLLLLGTGVVSTALSAGVAAAAPDVVALLLGPRWADAVPLVTVLAVGVPAMFVYVSCGITLDSLAALNPKLRLQVVLLLVKLGLVLALSSRGMPAIALAIVAAEWLRAACGLRLVVQLLGLQRTMVWRALGMLLAVALAVGVGVGVTRWLTTDAHWPLLARVLAEATAGLLALAALAVASLGRWSRFPPLQRFDAVRQWVGQAHRLVHPGAR